MIITDDPKRYFDEKRQADHEIKFVVICDKFYALNLYEIFNSVLMNSIEPRQMLITQEMLDSFPPPRHPVDYVTKELLETIPVVMLQTPGFDDLYIRIDGRHRILGAHKLGLNLLPAAFIPRTIWGQFIIGTRDKYSRIEKPLSWDRPPNIPKNVDPFHYEPNYILNREIDTEYNRPFNNTDFLFTPTAPKPTSVKPETKKPTSIFADLIPRGF